MTTRSVFGTLVTIPESAQCVHGPQWWTMSHPTRERLELRFPDVTPSSRLAVWISTAVLGLIAIIYALVGVLLLWPPISRAGIEVFLVVSLIFWGCALHVSPFGCMFIQELIIDTETGMMTGTALVNNKSVAISVPIAAVTEVKYFNGTNSGTSKSAAEIGIHFERPHLTMRFPRLAPREADLCDWVCAMLGQPTVKRSWFD